MPDDLDREDYLESTAADLLSVLCGEWDLPEPVELPGEDAPA